MTDPHHSPAADDSTAPNPDYASMGIRLRQAREFLGLSQEVVAENLGVPRASVSAMESGRRKVSSLELRDLSRLYKRPVDSLLGQEVAETPPDDETVQALFRATKNLTQNDKEQVLRFAEFLRGSGQAPARRKAR